MVYVPHAQADTHHALIELEAAGVVMQPGQQPPPRNTRLAIVGRNALKHFVGDERVNEYERQIEAGQLTLLDLDQLGDLGIGLSTAGLTLVYGTGNLSARLKRISTARCRRRSPLKTYGRFWPGTCWLQT